MAKKVRDEDDDFDEELNNDNIEETVEEDDEDFDDEKSGGSGLDLDDDEDLDILIEINEDDLEFLDKEEKKEGDESETDEIVLSKHKIEGKHSLKYDSIFKGKKEEPLDEDEMDGFAFYHKESIEVDKSSNYYFESIDNENYVRTKLVKERVYAILTDNTSLNFMNNRRKPSRNDFNQYYCLLKQNLESESFTNVELFNELAVYFSDNLFVLYSSF